MAVLQLIASNSFITLNRNLIKLFRMEGAAIVGMFASIANYNNNEWFYVTYERIEEELGLSKHIASKAIEDIIEAQILIDKREGIPCRRYFRFQEDKLFNALSLKNLTTSSKQDLPQASEVFDLPVVKKFNDINKNKDKNKISSSSLPSIEIAKKFAEEEDLKIDVEYWWKISRANGIKNDKSAMIAWAKDERNIVKPKSAPIEKPKEILKMENEIKKAMQGRHNSSDFDVYFLGNIELIEGEFFLKKKVPAKFDWVSEQFNLKK